jgi:UDP-N-acetylmuramoyl-tripeptide--D-alanyl-D-alanine ligase
MNHPGEIARLALLAAPTAGVILNAGRAHLGAFGSVSGIARAKAELIEALPAGGWAVLNADDAQVWARRGLTRARVAGFGLRAGDVRAEAPSFDRLGCVSFRLRTPGGTARVRTRLAGAHGALNGAAAAAVAWTHGVDLRAIAHGLEAFRPRARMRLERRRLRGGAVGIVDCYNANPDSYAAAFAFLNALRVRHPVLVIGEMRELGSHSVRAHRDVGKAAAALAPALLVGVGPLARPLVAAARRAGVRRAVWVREPGMAEAAVSGSLAPGAVVLFKASRKVALERLADRLAAGPAEPEAHRAV